jgi:hypothetical protein
VKIERKISPISKNLLELKLSKGKRHENSEISSELEFDEESVKSDKTEGEIIKENDEYSIVKYRGQTFKIHKLKFMIPED